MRTAIDLWGYAEGDARLVGGAVAVVVAAAVGYVARRLWSSRRERKARR